MFPLSLSAPVGTGRDNDEDDVKAVATNLSWLGYPEANPAAEKGQWDNGVEDGLRQYQRDRGLTADGWAGPGGETERALNGDLPRANRERDPESAAGTGTVERALNQLPIAVFGRAQPGGSLLDIDPPPRANPFAAARAHFAREGAGGLNSAPLTRRDAADPLFARNAVTGQPLLLKLLDSRPDEADPPATPSPDEVERILANRGYRYRPDPMGRLGEGDWLDAGGNALDSEAKQRIVHGGVSNVSRVVPANITTAEDFDRFVEQQPVFPATGYEDGAGEDEELAPAQDDGGGRAWGKFGAALAKGGKLIGGPNPIPADLARRIGYIKDQTTRTTIERMVSGGVPDKGGKFAHGGAYNIVKLGGRPGASMDFWSAVRQLGGKSTDVVVKPGGQMIFTARDGTRIIYRRKLMEREVTNEIQIETADRLHYLKVRYEDTLIPK